jgi:hypothetical protein
MLVGFAGLVMVGGKLREYEAKKANEAKLARAMGWWQREFGVPPPLSVADVENALKGHGYSVTAPDSGKKETAANRGGRSNITPACSELGLKGTLFTALIRGPDSYEINGQVLTFQEIRAAYATDLELAGQNCRYLVNVFPKNVSGEDFFAGDKQLRTVFYDQMQ